MKSRHIGLTLLGLGGLLSAPVSGDPIDRTTLDAWSAPYRGWHYWPEHVVPARPVIGSLTNLLGTDVPTVYQLPDNDRYFMSFIGFDGRGYQSFVAESEDLVRWCNYRLATAEGGIEQMGVAFSTDLLNWMRYPANPILRNRAGGYDENFCSDGKVYRDGDHWTMFYFGVGRGGAHIMMAFSRDLAHWTAHPEPLYHAGGHPGGLDKQYAHKTSLVFNPRNDTFYLFYNAVPGGNDVTGGRGIGLLTSKPLARSRVLGMQGPANELQPAP